MADHKIQVLADSAWLKLTGFAVTTIALPVLGWSLAAVLDRLGKMEAMIQANQVNSATTELRLRTNETRQQEVETMMRQANEKLVIHDYVLKGLTENRLRSAP
jgi:hypothetical protein